MQTFEFPLKLFKQNNIHTQSRRNSNKSLQVQNADLGISIESIETTHNIHTQSLRNSNKSLRVPNADLRISIESLQITHNIHSQSQRI